MARDIKASEIKTMFEKRDLFEVGEGFLMAMVGWFIAKHPVEVVPMLGALEDCEGCVEVLGTLKNCFVNDRLFYRSVTELVNTWDIWKQGVLEKLSNEQD